MNELEQQGGGGGCTVEKTGSHGEDMCQAKDAHVKVEWRLHNHASEAAIDSPPLTMFAALLWVIPVSSPAAHGALSQ